MAVRPNSIIGSGFDIIEADSLFMGCVGFSERFFPEGKLSARRFREAQLAAELELQSIAARYRSVGWSAVAGCSGTIHAVFDIVRANGWSDEGITMKALRKLRKALVSAGSVDALQLPGLQADRKPVISGGVAILEALFVDLGVDRMMVSPGALREGVLYDLFGRINHEDVRERTILRYQQRYHVDVKQSERVESTALSLLRDAAPTWGLDGPWAGQLLQWASRLYEVGLAISHTGYQKHSAYIVANSHLAGFSREEQRTLAALISAHRRRFRSEALAGLDPKRVADVRRLCMLFRLAVRLNRGRDGGDVPVTLGIKAAKKAERLRLVFPDGWLDQRPLTRAALEEEAGYAGELGFTLSIRSSSTPTNAPPTVLSDA